MGNVSHLTKWPRLSVRPTNRLTYIQISPSQRCRDGEIIIQVLSCLSLYETEALEVYLLLLAALAGDMAAAEKGQIALVAGDIVDFLPRAWRSLEEGCVR